MKILVFILKPVSLFIKDQMSMFIVQCGAPVLIF